MNGTHHDTAPVSNFQPYCLEHFYFVSRPKCVLHAHKHSNDSLRTWKTKDVIGASKVLGLYWSEPHENPWNDYWAICTTSKEGSQKVCVLRKWLKLHVPFLVTADAETVILTVSLWILDHLAFSLTCFPASSKRVMASELLYAVQVIYSHTGSDNKGLCVVF